MGEDEIYFENLYNHAFHRKSMRLALTLIQNQAEMSYLGDMRDQNLSSYLSSVWISSKIGEDIAYEMSRSLCDLMT